MSESRDVPDWLVLPVPGPATHKHSRGRLGVVSGPEHTGAARLAGRAGLRIGAGWVAVLCPPEARLPLSITLEAVMVQAFRDAPDLAGRARPLDAIVIGPGNGKGGATQANLRALANGGARLVVDADALSLFEGRSRDLFDLLRPDDVMTPHEGEFERLFPGLLTGGREVAARESARRAGATVLLKGYETLVATPDGRLYRHEAGCPWLATAGTGDVLAGMIGGLLAQGMEAFEASRAAVWLQSRAARTFGAGLIASDLPDLLPAVMRSAAPRPLT